jgi:outer membrane protein assembly factor BamB
VVSAVASVAAIGCIKRNQPQSQPKSVNAGLGSMAEPVLPIVPVKGCPTPHCDYSMSDQSNMEIPPLVSGRFGVPRSPKVIWSDRVASGSLVGLGCVADGQQFAVCSNNSPVDAVRAYTFDQMGRLKIKWKSGRELGNTAFTSAPSILADGSVIAADKEYLVMFEPDGKVLWKSALPQPTGSGSALPISPVIASTGHILVATLGGPVSLYDLGGKGKQTSVLELTQPDPLTGELIRFQTANTPCVRGDRAYILAEATGDRKEGALFALQITKDGAARIAWAFPFLKDSGASPTCINDVVYFDGSFDDGAGPKTTFFAVRDLGHNNFELVWKKETAGKMEASAAFAAGRLWGYSIGFPAFTSYDIGNGDSEVFDLRQLEGLGLRNPTLASAITVASSAGEPVLLGTVVELGNSMLPMNPTAVAIGIGRTPPRLIWKVKLGLAATGTNPGQWPILQSRKGPVMIFNTVSEGVKAIGMD